MKQAPENNATLAVRTDEKTGEHAVYVSAAPNLDAHCVKIGLMLGDVLHNQRCALDHLAWQLAMFNTGGSVQRSTRVRFPICSRPEEFKKACGAALTECHPEHRAFIERYQPYHGRAGRPDTWEGPYVHQLALLQQLSNADKHQVIHPTAVVQGLALGNKLAVLPLLFSVLDFARPREPKDYTFRG